jgi:glycogen debranching enzyme
MPPEIARSYLEPFGHQLQRYGVGTLAEIADGEAPFVPKGCIAQAWTVAQVLAAWQAAHPR